MFEENETAAQEAAKAAMGQEIADVFDADNTDARMGSSFEQVMDILARYQEQGLDTIATVSGQPIKLDYIQSTAREIDEAYDPATVESMQIDLSTDEGYDHLVEAIDHLARERGITSNYGIRSALSKAIATEALLRQARQQAGPETSQA